jgi:hypothetical protein
MRKPFALILGVALSVPLGQPAAASVPWTWPVTGAILRGFDPPDSPYGSGHRGIDIAAAVGTAVLATDDGVVSFAGSVGGRLFLTIDHGGGLTSTSSWLTSLLVRKGAHVFQGQPVATTGWGHLALLVPHLHFSVRLDGTYVDPLAYLGSLDVSSLIRLAPLDTATGTPTAASRMTNLAPVPSRVVRRGGRSVGGSTGIGPGDRRSVAPVPAGTGALRDGDHRPGAAVRRVVAGRGGHR